MEDKGKTNFFSVTLTKHCDQFKVATYRKPATTDWIMYSYLSYENTAANILIFDRI